MLYHFFSRFIAMAILSKLRSSSGSKLQKKKSSFLSNLKKFILCSSSCEDDKADVDNQFPDPPSDIEDDNVSIISLGDGISQLKIEGSGIQSESSKSGSETSGSSASSEYNYHITTTACYSMHYSHKYLNL